jgi:hypothetical protein
MTFAEWEQQFDEGKRLAMRPKKPLAVTHSEIDRWLKSVDGLAKELKDLSVIKKKALEKMNKIPKSKTKEPEKPIKQNEKPENADEKRNDLAVARKSKPEPKPKPKSGREQEKPDVE